MKLYLLTLLSLTFSIHSFAQLEESNWIFGFNCEIRFDDGIPVDEGESFMYVTEGSASISTADGQLQFSTDGSVIYDRFGDVMENGNQVQGDDSSTQNVLIVPLPGDEEERYYLVFSVPSQLDVNGNFSNSGLGFCRVDMAQNGGLGAVVTNYVELAPNVGEMLHATWHANQRDVWVVCHEVGSSNFHSYLVTCNGIEGVRVSESGRDIEFSEFAVTAIGSIKLSPDGSKVAITQSDISADQMQHDTYLLIGDFNNSTGEITITNEIHKYTENTHQGYGVEFSPNSNMLYWTILGAFPTGGLFQYNLESNDIAASEVQIAQSNASLANIQLAANEIIYVARGGGSQFLSAIEFPNLPGQNCGYVDQMVELSGYSSLGLPNVWMYPYPDRSVAEDFQEVEFCEGTHSKLSAIDLGGDSYLWNNGEITPTITITSSGEYRVEVFASCHRVATRTFYVEIIPEPVLEINANPEFACAGDEVELSVSADVSWVWSDGNLENPRSVWEAGVYSVSYSLDQCDWNKSIEVEFNDLPEFEIPELLSYCILDPKRISLELLPGEFVLWSDGVTAPSRVIDNPGNYSVTVSNQCGSSSANFIAEEIDCACPVYVPNAFTPDGDGLNEFFKAETDCDVRDFQIDVYNRWGALIFSSNNPQKVWTGNVNGGDHYAPDGVYVWKMSYRTPANERRQLSGMVSLLR